MSRNRGRTLRGAGMGPGATPVSRFAAARRPYTGQPEPQAAFFVLVPALSLLSRFYKGARLRTAECPGHWQQRAHLDWQAGSGPRSLASPKWGRRHWQRPRTEEPGPAMWEAPFEPARGPAPSRTDLATRLATSLAGSRRPAPLPAPSRSSAPGPSPCARRRRGLPAAPRVPTFLARPKAPSRRPF